MLKRPYTHSTLPMAQVEGGSVMMVGNKLIFVPAAPQAVPAYSVGPQAPIGKVCSPPAATPYTTVPAPSSPVGLPSTVRAYGPTTQTLGAQHPASQPAQSAQPAAQPTPQPQAAALGSLHYGGSRSARTGLLGCKPTQGGAFKAQKRLELICRMENAAMSEHQIATMLLISIPRLRTIKKSPDYLKARMKITFGLIIDQSESLAAVKAQRREMLTAMLPAALQIIANAVSRPAVGIAQEKLQISVAQDLLDREGTFAKVSRAEIKPVSSFSFESVDESSDSVIAAIKGTGASRSAPKATDDTTVTEALELAAQFSRSKTLSAVDQQTALDDLDKELLRALPTRVRVQ